MSGPPPEDGPAMPRRQVVGIPAVPGIGVGRAWWYRRRRPEITRRRAGDPTVERGSPPPSWRRPGRTFRFQAFVSGSQRCCRAGRSGTVPSLHLHPWGNIAALRPSPDLCCAQHRPRGGDFRLR